MASLSSMSYCPGSSWTGQRGLQPLPDEASTTSSAPSHRPPIIVLNHVSIPDHWLLDHSAAHAHYPRSLDASVGAAVLKLNKAGKVQPRRIALTADRRNLVISSHKITLKGLFSKLTLRRQRSKPKPPHTTAIQSKTSTPRAEEGRLASRQSQYPPLPHAGATTAATTNTPSSALACTDVKTIPFEAVDRIQVGATTHRFFMARHDALLHPETAPHELKQLLTTTTKTTVPESPSMTMSISLTSMSMSSNKNNINNNNRGGGGGGEISSRCLSIIYLKSVSTSDSGASSGGGGNNNCKLVIESLDLIVPDPTEYETLVSVLEELHQYHVQERLRTCPSLQRLEAQWLLLGKEYHEPLSVQEFLTLCQRLQVPFKRNVLTHLFKEELAAITATTTSSSYFSSGRELLRAATSHVTTAASLVNSTTTTNNTSQQPQPQYQPRLVGASHSTMTLATTSNNGIDTTASRSKMMISGVGSAVASSGSATVDAKLGFVGVANILEIISQTSTTTSGSNQPQPPTSSSDHNPELEKMWQDLIDADPVPPVKLTTTNDLNNMASSPSSSSSSSTTTSAAAAEQIASTAAVTSTEGMNMMNKSFELNLSSEESISALAFLSFLRTQQKEFHTTLEQATELIQILNSQTSVELWHEQQQQRMAHLQSKASHAESSSSLMTIQHSDTASTFSIPLQSSAQQDRLTKSRYMDYLTSDTNDLLHPAMGSVGYDDMTRPLSHYWIHTSHDTYLESLESSLFAKSQYRQFAHASSHAATTGTTTSTITNHSAGNREWNVEEQPYMAALLRGVRCIEVDVWDGLDDKEPVIARWKPTSPNDRRLSLSIVLYIIRSFLDQHPQSFPILLKLENHATSLVVQQNIAHSLVDILGSKCAKLTLDQQPFDTASSLPSPEALRGKVIVIGKRPKKLVSGAKVCRDDFDVDIDSFHALEKTRELSLNAVYGSDDMYYDMDDSRAVVGFTTKCPIRAPLGEGQVARSTDELHHDAILEHHRAKAEVEKASVRVREREAAADAAESQAIQFTHLSGWTFPQVKERALQLQQGSANPTQYGELDQGEEKASKDDEGLEVYQVLPEFVEGSRGRYGQATRDAMEASGREAQLHALLQEKETSLRMAIDNLNMSRQREASIMENAKKARTEAIANQEHAEAARERVVKVRDLFQNSKDQTSTAGNVVQTALTEAKISEKRAADTAARAARAKQAADADRQRADDETRKEELLEQQVNDLHEDCLQATEVTRQARERLEKAATMLERVNDQLKIIEASSQYRAELKDQSLSATYRGGSFITKHTKKLEEREMCQELIRESSAATASAESQRNEFQQAFEDRAYEWRIQAGHAAQARRIADRSLHLAEELLEQAEEEREAANLRHTACQRAEATVENKGSYRMSLEAQLVEAEKAVVEATNIATQSKKRAEEYTRESNKGVDHSRFQKSVEEKELERDKVRMEYDEARKDREGKDQLMTEEKRRLDTNAEVCKEATREAVAETDRVREELHYQHEAVVACVEALVLRREANDALADFENLKLTVESKKLIADRAREYKSKMDLMAEIPLDLVRLTLVHSAKYLNWSKSMSISSFQLHSFAHNVLLLMLTKNADDDKRNFLLFTKNHLTRIFPSWKILQTKNFTNYDPVLAWSLGCQLVACNLHSTDESLLVADGRFRQNGSCGYVLKPAYLTDKEAKVESSQHWTLQLLSASYLPQPQPLSKVSGCTHPLVKVSIYSGSFKETRVTFRTRPARPVGLHYVWTSGNKFDLVIPTPSISMITLSVWHVNDNEGGGGGGGSSGEVFVAAAAIPACGVREGFRSVALFDERHARSGEFRNACLLVRAVKKDHSALAL